MIQCEGCGTQNAPGAAYCAQCARKLDAATQAAVVERRAAHTATGIAWMRILVALIIFVLIAAVVAVLVVHGI